MPRFQGATYFTMKGGLNSEASPLNIPQQDAIDLSNVDINIDGSIERRRAIDFLGVDSQTGEFYLESEINDYNDKLDVPEIFLFNPIRDDGTIEKIVIVRFGGRMYYYDYSSPESLKNISQYIYQHSIDQAIVPTETGPVQYNTTFLADGNKLFIVNKKHAFGYIQYKDTPDPLKKFTWNSVFIRIRDNRVLDEDAPEPEKGEEPVYKSVIKNASILNEGWTTGCLQGSRIWLAGVGDRPNTLFFSQTISEGDEYGRMYQEADPYDPLDNLLVDTDGGTIAIAGAERIIALAPLGAGVLVFANNGVWAIGGQDGFRPTSYSINKISDAGIAGEKCWCSVEQQIVFFGHSNIYTVLLGTSIDTPEVQVIGDKIHNFYRNIPQYCLKGGRAVYNPEIKKVYFFVNFTKYTWFKLGKPEDASTMMRDALVLDVRLNAWTKYSLSSDPDGAKPAICAAALFDNGTIQETDVVDGGALVTDDGAVVTVQDLLATGSAIVTNLLFVKKSGTTFKMAFGELISSGLTDFSKSIDDAEDNASFITIAHQLFKDAAHRKFAPYIIPLFKRVESGVLDSNGVDITPGGCKYRVDWDWAVNSNSKKFGTLRNAYFPYKFTTSMFDGGDNGLEVVTSKLKIRGSGQVFKLHFESDGNKDFKLYGWQMMMYAKGRV